MKSAKSVKSALGDNRFSLNRKNLMVMELKIDAVSRHHLVSRNAVLSLAQQKCLEMFGQSAEIFRLRDVRMLIPDSTISEPVIAVRMLACLINLGTLRCLVLWDRLLLFVPNGADELIKLLKTKLEELSHGIFDSNLNFVQEQTDAHAEDGDETDNESLHDWPSRALHLRKRRHTRGSNDEVDASTETMELVRAWSVFEEQQSTTNIMDADDEGGVGSGLTNGDTIHEEKEEEFANHSPQKTHFELLAYEAALWTAMKLLERDHGKLKPEVTKTTQRALREQNESSLERLRQIRGTVNRLLGQAERQVAAITEVTLNDRDMALMSFSNVLRNPDRYKSGEPESEWIHDHQDVELLFESYVQRFDSIIYEIRYLIEEVEQAEANIAVKLDVARNRLLRMIVGITAVTAFSGVGAFIAGIFGMNLYSNLENTTDPPVFWIVTGVLLAFFVVGVTAVIIFAMRL